MKRHSIFTVWTLLFPLPFFVCRNGEPKGWDLITVDVAKSYLEKKLILRNKLRHLLMIGFSFIILSLVLSGCQSGYAEKIPTNLPIDYFVPLSPQVEMNVGDLFEEYYYIPLETREESLLDGIESIRNIAIHKGEIYVAVNSQIIVWDNQGRYKRSLSKRGQGSDEYQSLGDFQIWPDGGITLVSGEELITYSSSFNLVHRQRFAGFGYIETFAALDDSLVIVKKMPAVQGMTRYSVVNRFSGDIISEYDTIKKVNKYISAFANSFQHFDGHIISHGYQGNEILECMRDSSRVRYRLNIDNRVPPPGFWAQDGKSYTDILLEESLKGYIGHIPDYIESPERILFSFKGKKEELEGIGLIDKKDGRGRVLGNILFDDDFRWLPKQFFTLDDGWCVMLIDPYEILKKETFAQRFPGLDEESNPVLFLAKMK